MKRLRVLAAIAFLLLAASGTVGAQGNFGITAGVTFSHINLKPFETGMMTQYHAGATYRFKLPLGFSIQPSLLYQVKGTNATAATDGLKARVGYLELPVSVQWGPDLILFRPFLDVTPFVGYGLNNKFWSANAQVRNFWEGMSRWEYGIGLGVGLEIWKFQLVARYNWNLESITKDTTISEIAGVIKDKSNFSGVALSLSYLF